MMLTTKLTSIMKFRALTYVVHIHLSEITIFIKFAKTKRWGNLRRHIFKIDTILKKPNQIIVPHLFHQSKKLLVVI